MVSQKKQKKRGGKKQVDAYAKKLWYDVYAPAPFKNQYVCKTPVNKSSGMKLSENFLKNRTFEVNASDLNGMDESVGHLLFKLRVGHSQNNICYTTFHGMRLTKDKKCGIVRKNRSLITAYVDVKTTDAYKLRLTIYGTAKRRRRQISKTTYVHQSQRKKIVEKIKQIVAKIINKCDITKLVEVVLNRYIEQELENQCSCIFPLCQTQIAKVRVLHTPKLQIDQVLKLYENREEEED